MTHRDLINKRLSIIKQACVEGKPIWVKQTNGKWKQDKGITSVPLYVDVRVGKGTPLAVRWNDLPAWANYVAADSTPYENPDVFYYSLKPKVSSYILSGGYWIPDDKDEYNGRVPASAIISKCPVNEYKTSLVKRPKVKPRKVKKKVDNDGGNPNEAPKGYRAINGGGGCHGCVFYNTAIDRYCPHNHESRIKCIPSRRADGRDVIFIKK